MIIITTFTVEGEGKFPFEMLCVSTCFPKTIEDVAKLNAMDHRQITLVAALEFVENKWENTNWKIVKIEKHLGHLLISRRILTCQSH